eukprot:783844-Pelagomonas_calceolata.AAC.1
MHAPASPPRCRPQPGALAWAAAASPAASACPAAAAVAPVLLHCRARQQVWEGGEPLPASVRPWTVAC